MSPLDLAASTLSAPSLKDRLARRFGRLFAPTPCELFPHYPSRAERVADFWVHAVGLGLAAAGGLVLVVAALTRGGVGQASATAIYAVCLIAMLGASALYNLRKPCPKRRLLRRLDEAAIFLMIAGSYTPFTTQRFDGGWAEGMTALVWSVAGLGVLGKLFFPNISEKAWCAVYVGFGWLAVLALKPLIAGLSLIALLLLALGGLLYTAGVPFFLNPAQPYRRAVWHAFVVAAAATHFAAVAAGVVFA